MGFHPKVKIRVDKNDAGCRDDEDDTTTTTTTTAKVW